MRVYKCVHASSPLTHRYTLNNVRLFPRDLFLGKSVSIDKRQSMCPHHTGRSARHVHYHYQLGRGDSCPKFRSDLFFLLAPPPPLMVKP